MAMNFFLYIASKYNCFINKLRIEKENHNYFFFFSNKTEKNLC